MARELLTVDQAAQRLNVSPRFVRRLISERRVAFVRLGRHVRLATEDLDAFVAAGRSDVLAPRRLRAIGNKKPRPKEAG
jgi:excisionase family DNA binding protein